MNTETYEQVRLTSMIMPTILEDGLNCLVVFHAEEALSPRFAEPRGTGNHLHRARCEGRHSHQLAQARDGGHRCWCGCLCSSTTAIGSKHTRSDYTERIKVARGWPTAKNAASRRSIARLQVERVAQVTQAINSETPEAELMAQYVGQEENLGIDRLVLYAADLDGQRWSLLVSEGTDSAWPASRPASFFESRFDGLTVGGWTRTSTPPM